MKVFWTDEALRHLDSIYRHIAEDAPVYAQRMVDKITRRSRLALSRNRDAWFRNTGTLIFGKLSNRRIESCIRVTADRVDVLAVFHGARLLPDDPGS